MQDLTGDARFPANLAPSLGEIGNMSAAPRIKAGEMTAPGSVGAIPEPEAWVENPLGPHVSDMGSRPDPLPVNWPPRLGEKSSSITGWTGNWTKADGEPGPWSRPGS